MITNNCKAQSAHYREKGVSVPFLPRLSASLHYKFYIILFVLSELCSLLKEKVELAMVMPRLQLISPVIDACFFLKFVARAFSLGWVAPQKNVFSSCCLIPHICEWYQGGF